MDALLVFGRLDDAEVQSVLGLLGQRDIKNSAFGDMDEALRALERQPFTMVLVFQHLGQRCLEFLEQLRERAIDAPAVVLTAPDSVPSQLLRALDAGAEDTAPVPSELSELDDILSRGRASPPSRIETHDEELLGTSPAMDELRDTIARAADSDSTVLIRGESGSGKELVARSVHRASARRAGPFVKVHCAALPDDLLESELFGYERGAFTGAVGSKPGRVALTEGGTLFLDEIGDITAAMQVKLLRLLQDREYEPLGSNTTRKANVRFVAATHRDLEARSATGQFRRDLFYRLNVIPLWVPPLRARREDIGSLVGQFVRQFSEANRKRVRLDPRALAALERRSWPGNVRQLQNFIERLVVLAESDYIGLDALNQAVQTIDTMSNLIEDARTIGGSQPSVVTSTSTSEVRPLSEEIRRAEVEALQLALQHAEGNRVLAAKLLGISRATLYKKLQEHDLG